MCGGVAATTANTQATNSAGTPAWHSSDMELPNTTRGSRHRSGAVSACSWTVTPNPGSRGESDNHPKHSGPPATDGVRRRPPTGVGARDRVVCAQQWNRGAPSNVSTSVTRHHDADSDTTTPELPADVLQPLLAEPAALPIPEPPPALLAWIDTRGYDHTVPQADT